MATVIRAEVSEKNKYWINKHRHYELKHFCLQYPTWKKAYVDLDSVGIASSMSELIPKPSIMINVVGVLFIQTSFSR